MNEATEQNSTTEAAGPDERLVKRLNEAKKELRDLKMDFAMHLVGTGTQKAAAEKMKLSTTRIRQLVERRRHELRNEWFQQERSEELLESDKRVARAVVMLHKAGFNEGEISTIFDYGYKCHGASLDWANAKLDA